MAERSVTTVAVIGGEYLHSELCIIYRPKSCTAIKIGKDILTLAGKWVEDEYIPVNVGERELSTKLHLPKVLLEKTGRPGVLVTADEAYFNLDWFKLYPCYFLASQKMRRIIRWAFTFPTDIHRGHPEFFINSQEPVSLN